jgi:3-deoxy-D-arabino-heptulosonate 7-phosphate (DAHP) synthase class II
MVPPVLSVLSVLASDLLSVAEDLLSVAEGEALFVTVVDCAESGGC